MAGNVNKANAKAAGFTPELWIDETHAVYESNLVLAKLVLSMPHAKNKKGDTIHVPRPSRSAAAVKAAGTDVTFTEESGAEATISLNQHWYVAKKVEDIAEIQSNVGMRKFYTKDFGYSLSKAVDTYLAQVFRKVQGGNGTAVYDKAVIGSDGSTLYTSGSPNAAALTDAGFRRALQTLDDADVPVAGRFLTVPPVGRRTLLGIDRFVSSDFRGDGKSAVVSGKFGDVYGVPVFVTSNADTATGGARICVLGQEEAAALAMQKEVRIQSQYVVKSLATELVADCIFGADELHNEGAICIAIPA